MHAHTYSVLTCSTLEYPRRSISFLCLQSSASVTGSGSGDLSPFIAKAALADEHLGLAIICVPNGTVCLHFQKVGD